ncbi:hypothetical protein GCM10010339_08570 [Streptomyces alanosinicus]|uniref:Uncharacterized protein n=1 Tax=Streptomyces alanosinicus TaxID=68171 RepID=A0A918YCN4_9ACTN|nr:hypothetical protein GCM10010339_08570 [Streptomyces alanosinicus]
MGAVLVDWRGVFGTVNPLNPWVVDGLSMWSVGGDGAGGGSLPGRGPVPCTPWAPAGRAARSGINCASARGRTADRAVPGVPRSRP